MKKKEWKKKCRELEERLASVANLDNELPEEARYALQLSMEYLTGLGRDATRVRTAIDRALEGATGGMGIHLNGATEYMSDGQSFEVGPLTMRVERGQLYLDLRTPEKSKGAMSPPLPEGLTECLRLDTGNYWVKSQGEAFVVCPEKPVRLGEYEYHWGKDAISVQRIAMETNKPDNMAGECSTLPQSDNRLCSGNREESIDQFIKGNESSLPREPGEMYELKTRCPHGAYLFNPCTQCPEGVAAIR